MSNYKSIEKFIDYSVKAIPLLIFLFLLINFIFNSGYFFIIGNKFLSLLTLSDYYEGSAPLVSITILSFAVIFNAVFLNYHVRASFVYFKLIFGSKISIPLRILKIKMGSKIHYRLNYSKYSYSDKKLLIKKIRELENIKNDMITNIKDLKEFNYLISWTLFSIILLPIIILFINSFFISMRMFYILLIIYVCIIVSASKKNNAVKYYYLTILTITLIFCLGLWCFLRDYTLDTVSYNAEIKENVQVIRPISKGILIKNQEGISLIDWNGRVLFKRKQCGLINLLITNSDYEMQREIDKSIEKTYKRGKRFINKGIKDAITTK